MISIAWPIETFGRHWSTIRTAGRGGGGGGGRGGGGRGGGGCGGGGDALAARWEARGVELVGERGQCVGRAALDAHRVKAAAEGGWQRVEERDRAAAALLGRVAHAHLAHQRRAVPKLVERAAEARAVTTTRARRCDALAHDGARRAPPAFEGRVLIDEAAEARVRARVVRVQRRPRAVAHSATLHVQHRGVVQPIPREPLLLPRTEWLDALVPRVRGARALLLRYRRAAPPCGAKRGAERRQHSVRAHRLLRTTEANDHLPPRDGGRPRTHATHASARHPERLCRGREHHAAPARRGDRAEACLIQHCQHAQQRIVVQRLHHRRVCLSEPSSTFRHASIINIPKLRVKLVWVMFASRGRWA